MDKLKYIRIQQENDQYYGNIPIGVDAENVDLINGNNLQDTLGSYDYKTQGSIKQKLDTLPSVAEEVATNIVNTAVDTATATLNARMDTFTKLPTGSTSADAELMDIRVKADGPTATTAGNAVREQFTELKQDLDSFLENVKINGYTIIPDVYIGPAAGKIVAYGGQSYTSVISIPIKPNTTYIIKKNTVSIMRVACGNIESPAPGYQTSTFTVLDTPSSDALEITSTYNDLYMYIQLFVKEDGDGLRNINAHIPSLIVSESKKSFDKLTISIGNEILLPVMHATSREVLPICIYSKTSPTDIDNEGFWATQPVPIPETIDNKIIHNGIGAGDAYAITFWDQNMNFISGGKNSSGYAVNIIPSGAKYFILSLQSTVSEYDFVAKFFVNNKEAFNYNIELARYTPKYEIISLLDNVAWNDVRVNPSGDEVEATEYKTSDYIEIPDELFVNIIANYAYTASTTPARIAFYNSEKQFISSESSNSKRINNYQIPDGARYFRIGTHDPTISIKDARAYALRSLTATEYYLKDYMIDENEGDN